MKVLIHINGSHNPARTNFVSWAPSPCVARLTEVAPGTVGPVKVTLKNQRTDIGGQVVFYKGRNTDATDTLQLDLPVDGTPVPFLAGGKFQRASTENGDAAIEAVKASDGTVLGTQTLMVRVRKDAETLTSAERDRFLNALATLNGQGHGRFSEFQAMHTGDGDLEAHGDNGFVSWHRAYLVDLERELQAIDPSVALPYWRFAAKAPKVFSADFMGVPRPTTGTVEFSAGNPLVSWRTDMVDGITRDSRFNTATSQSQIPGAPPIFNDEDIRRMGPVFSDFSDMQGNPHGYAHVSLIGDIDDPFTAPKDPLFYMLHCNVDRLWAMWQWFHERWDVTQGTDVFLDGNRIGHRQGDTMWPWNGSRTAPRPNITPPGGTLAASPIVTAPGQQPRVKDTFDYQGKLKAENRMDFDYDDVPFEW